MAYRVLGLSGESVVVVRSGQAGHLGWVVQLSWHNIPNSISPIIYLDIRGPRHKTGSVRESHICGEGGRGRKGGRERQTHTYSHTHTQRYNISALCWPKSFFRDPMFSGWEQWNEENQSVSRCDKANNIYLQAIFWFVSKVRTNHSKAILYIMLGPGLARAPLLQRFIHS